MSEALQPCQGLTKAGKPCKNSAVPGSNFCHVHQAQAASATLSPAEVKAAIADVSRIADEIKKEAPEYQPPPFSPQALIALVQRNIERFTPEVRIPLLDELRRNLQGTKPEDLVDPETWKGLWYILNYTTQAQSKQAVERIEKQMAALPGGQAMRDLMNNLAGTSPKDLLDIETWKGALVILDATVKAQSNEIKKKVLGDKDAH